MLKKTTIEKISQLAAELMEKGMLLAPVKEVSGHNFKQIADPKAVDLEFLQYGYESKESLSFPTRKILSSIRLGNRWPRPNWLR